MKSIQRAIARRAVIGFALGVAVCVAYWATGFIPRPIWYESWAGGLAITLSGWLTPFGILDIVFREMPPSAITVILYGINGMFYAAMSVSLFSLRSRSRFYLSVLAALLTVLVWLNGLTDLFSWLAFLIVCVLLILIALQDLRSREPPIKEGV